MGKKSRLHIDEANVAVRKWRHVSSFSNSSAKYREEQISGRDMFGMKVAANQHLNASRIQSIVFPSIPITSNRENTFSVIL